MFFSEPGIYVVRCWAQPIVNGDDAEVIHDASVAILPVIARDPELIAKGAIDDTTHERFVNSTRLAEIDKLINDPSMDDPAKKQDRDDLLREKAFLKEQMLDPSDLLKKESDETGEEIKKIKRRIELRNEIKELRAELPSEQQKKDLSDRIKELDAISEIEGDNYEDEKTLKNLKEQQDQLTTKIGNQENRKDEHEGAIAERLDATFIGDLGANIKLNIELFDLGVIDLDKKTKGNKNVQARKIFLSDLTTPSSGVGRGEFESDRPDNDLAKASATRKALKDCLETSSDYGRGLVAFRIYSEVLTQRIEAGTGRMLSEALENTATVLSIGAILAAPFTAGESLVLLLPLGAIAAIPSAYRIYTRVDAGTFRWFSQDTIMDILNIAGGLIGLGQAATPLRMVRLGQVWMVLGLGVNGASVMLMGAGIVQQLEALQNLPEGERAARMVEILSGAFLQLGIQVGAAAAHARYAGHGGGANNEVGGFHPAEEAIPAERTQKAVDSGAGEKRKLPAARPTEPVPVTDHPSVTEPVPATEPAPAVAEEPVNKTDKPKVQDPVVERTPDTKEPSQKEKDQQPDDRETVGATEDKSDKKSAKKKSSEKTTDEPVTSPEKPTTDSDDQRADYEPEDGKGSKSKKTTTKKTDKKKKPSKQKEEPTTDPGKEIKEPENKTPEPETKPAEPENKTTEPAETKSPEATTDKNEESNAAKDEKALEESKNKLRLLKQQRAAANRKLRRRTNKRNALEKNQKETIEKRKQAYEELSNAEGEERVAAQKKYDKLSKKFKSNRDKLNKSPSNDDLLGEISGIDKQIDFENSKNPKSIAKLPCFSKGTRVSTENGFRSIEELVVGEKIWTYNFSTKELNLNPIMQLHKNHAQVFYEINLNGELIRATGQHRFWVENLGGWYPASELQSGYYLKTSRDEKAIIHRIDKKNGEVEHSYNLSIDGSPNYFVGMGVLVHNDAVDIGLGGEYLIYRAVNNKNPAFKGRVYIGQTTETDIHGDPRGEAVREMEHQNKALEKLGLHDQQIKLLSEANKEFYEFMKDATLEVIVKGISTQDIADYVEQKNIDIERAKYKKNPEYVMNRRNQVKSGMKDLIERIKADPKVKKLKLCP